MGDIKIVGTDRWTKFKGKFMTDRCMHLHMHKNNLNKNPLFFNFPSSKEPTAVISTGELVIDSSNGFYACNDGCIPKFSNRGSRIVVVAVVANLWVASGSETAAAAASARSGRASDERILHNGVSARGAWD